MFSDHKFFDRFINLSTTNFSNQETALLNKGFKHNINNKFDLKESEILAVETEVALINVPFNTPKKYICADIIKKEFLSNKPNLDNEINIARAIQNKAKNNNIIFTKADKGNTIVAIDQQQYIDKTLEFIKKGNFKILLKDPTEKFKKDIRTALGKASSIISDNQISKLTVMNHQPPLLYSLVKLHKENHPIRPVASYISAPAYKLSKFLIDIIKTNINFTPTYTIKNSLELTEKISNVFLPDNSKLVSFDVQNLFPSIPPDETVKIIKTFLIKNKVNIVIQQDILNLLNTSLNQNYFYFNNTFYNSSEGLIMGSPLSPLLAEIFMDNLEKQIHRQEFSKSFLYWYRYVDDIFACFNGTERQLDNVFNYINSIHKNIKFTMELEVDNKINFLDLTITRHYNKHKFSIFHKPSHTDTTINIKSAHPLQHKLAAYHSMLHRLVSVPLSVDDFNKELNLIKQIAVNNGYSPDTIDSILNKKLKNKAISLVYPKKENTGKKYNVLTYFGNTSEKIKNHLNKYNINIAFRTNNSLGKFIKNAKGKQNRSKKSGVYQLNCGSCHKSYIGQTGRSFETRILEHKRSYLKNKTDSAYSNHLTESNHLFDDKFKILHIQNKGVKLNLLENLEINRIKNSDIILNEQKDTCLAHGNSPLLNLYN